MSPQAYPLDMSRNSQRRNRPNLKDSLTKRKINRLLKRLFVVNDLSFIAALQVAIFSSHSATGPPRELFIGRFFEGGRFFIKS